MKNLVLIFSIALLIGCGVTVKPQSAIQLNAPSEKAYVVVGATIGEGNIEQMVMALIVNGKKLLPAGVVLAEQTRRPTLADADYVRLDNNRHGYCVFEVPGELFKKSANAILYITSLSNKNPGGIWWYYRMPPPGIMGGILVNAPITATDDNGNRSSNGTFSGGWWNSDKARWSFLGNSFRINKPGIYYAGDIQIKGDLQSGSKFKVDNNYQFAFIKASARSDHALFKKFIAEKNLATVSYIDVSQNFAELPGKDWWSYVKGKK